MKNVGGWKKGWICNLSGKKTNIWLRGKIWDYWWGHDNLMYFEYMHIYSKYKSSRVVKTFSHSWNALWAWTTLNLQTPLILLCSYVCSEFFFFFWFLLLTKFLYSLSVKEKCKEASGRAAVCTKTVPHHLLVIKFPSSCFQERLVHAKAFMTETPDPPPRHPNKSKHVHG